MELLTIKLSAGESKRFEKPGRYFEIIDSTGAVRVDFYSVSGRQTDQMVNALSGLFLEASYGAFTITSATSQSVSFLLLENGRGGSRRQPGVVQVTYPVSSSVQQNNVNDTVAAATLGFSVVRTIVAPASNLKGVKWHSTTSYVVAGVGGYSDCRVIAAPSAPTSLAPANSFLIGFAGASDSASSNSAKTMMNLTLPAGWGVYVVVSNSVSTPTAVANENCFELV